ncbi:1,6-anhydro-N-acetylmuramyl-L-alanine amidase AmpD [Robbsia sp. KACC 23696]|uniref:1,6-anhydro-N-acetylmuramyl-L-alanine amidase AmpD n=1 Tax=Robbsia sp. KACC 23696 TaxID=3149231 RepID=UPI00325B3C20
MPINESRNLILDANGWVWPVEESASVASGLKGGQVCHVAEGEGTVVHQRSPNADVRARGTEPSLLVIHNISLPPGRFGTGDVQAFFNNTLDCSAEVCYAALANLRVSSHFLVARDGAITQFVSTCERAWHAGVSAFEGRERCNDFAIGIELEGTDTAPFDAAQYRSLAALTAAVTARHPIDAIAGHEHIAPGRKTDPGPHFNWSHYARLSNLSSVLLRGVPESARDGAG